MCFYIFYKKKKTNHPVERKIKIKKQQKYFGNVKSSDEFSLATPDETAAKDTEFSPVVSFRNKLFIKSTFH